MTGNIVNQWGETGALNKWYWEKLFFVDKKIRSDSTLYIQGYTLGRFKNINVKTRILKLLEENIGHFYDP